MASVLHGPGEVIVPVHANQPESIAMNVRSEGEPTRSRWPASHWKGGAMSSIVWGDVQRHKCPLGSETFDPAVENLLARRRCLLPFRVRECHHANEELLDTDGFPGLKRARFRNWFLSASLHKLRHRRLPNNRRTLPASSTMYIRVSAGSSSQKATFDFISQPVEAAIVH